MKTPTLYDAVTTFLAPLMAEYGNVIEEGADSMPVTIKIGGYQCQMTLAALKKLNAAHEEFFEALQDDEE